MDEDPYSVVQLNVLTDAIHLAEVEHHQDIPLREDFNHIPRGCSCGLTYDPARAWEASKRHLREVAARAVVAALHRPCDSCLGSGIWHRLRQDYECPECGGRGRTLTPLPEMTFQDPDGSTWVVEGFEARERDSIWAQVHRDV